MDLITRDPLFGKLFDELYDTKGKHSLIKSDIYEKDGKYVIEADVPGFKKEDIKVDYDDGYLTVSATREEVIEENTNYIRKERHYGEFSRSYYVGNISEESIKAKFENGTLVVTFPKEEAKNTTKLIDIE